MIHQIVTTFLLFWLSLQVFSPFEAAIIQQFTIYSLRHVAYSTLCCISDVVGYSMLDIQTQNFWYNCEPKFRTKVSLFLKQNQISVQFRIYWPKMILKPKYSTHYLESKTFNNTNLGETIIRI
jgi:hypothetical protein